MCYQILWSWIYLLATLVSCSTGYEAKPISSTLSPVNRRQFNVNGPNGPSKTPSPRDFGPSVSVLPPPGHVLMPNPLFRPFHPNQFQQNPFGPSQINSPPLQQIAVGQPFQFNPGNIVPIPSSTVNIPFIQYVNKLKATYFTPPKFSHPPSSPFKFNQDFVPKSSYSSKQFSPDINTESERYPQSKGRYQPYGVGDSSEAFRFSSWRPVNPSEESSGPPGSRFNNFQNNPRFSSNSDYSYEDNYNIKDKDAHYKVLFIKTTPNSREVHFPDSNRNSFRELDSSSQEKQRASILYLLSKEGEPKLEKVVRVPLPGHPFSSNYGSEEQNNPNVLYVRYNKPYTTVSEYGVKDDYYDSFDRENKFNSLYKSFLSRGIDSKNYNNFD